MNINFHDIILIMKSKKDRDCVNINSSIVYIPLRINVYEKGIDYVALNFVIMYIALL